MNFWLTSIVSVVILTSILSLIVPEGSIGKIIKGLFSLVTILIIIEPIIGFLSSENEVNIFSENSEIVLQEDFLFSVNENKVIALENGCKKILCEYGFTECDCNINYEINEKYKLIVKKVYLKLNFKVINQTTEHKINIEKAITGVMNYLGVEREIIDLYE